MKDIHYPPIVHWEVTSACNHNCIHCYNYWRKNPDIIGECEKSDLLELAEKITSFKPVVVVVTGGEPLLVYKELKEPLILLKNSGIFVSVNTNAALVTDEIADFFAKNSISAFVSLPCGDPDICDQITNKKDSLDILSKGVRKLVNAGVFVSVNMVVSQLNKNYIYETAEYAKKELGVKHFFASRVSKPINSTSEFNKELLNRQEIEDMLNQLVRIKHELGLNISVGAPIPACLLQEEEMFQEFAFLKSCTAGRFSYCVDFSGNIKACVREECTYGNIKNEDFQTIWSRMSPWRTEQYVASECGECKHRWLCKGGCRLESYPFTKEMGGIDPAARPEKLPLRFQKQQNLGDTKFPLSAEFLLLEGVRFVREDFGYRVSCQTNYTYITQEFAEYLMSNNQFTLNKLIETFGAPYDVVNSLFNLLVSKGIIKERRTC